MNASELNRLLLFHGQNDVTDFLRSSPLNRFLYKKLLGVLSASGIAVPAVKLFNEIYYQCARVNYDGMPGVDVGRRYWSEAAGWMDSPEGAQLVFCAVWAVLGLKRSHTFHEECFLGALAPYLRNSVYARFAEGLAGELRLSGISVPDRFPVMTCPVSEIVAAFTLTKEQAKGFWGYEDPARLIVEDAWRGTWANVTCDYSPSVIEQYVRLYADQEDQLKLIACMKAPLYPKKHPAQRQFLTDLGQRIATGGFDPEEHPLLQPAVSLDTETKESGGFRLDLGLGRPGVQSPRRGLAREGALQPVGRRGGLHDALPFRGGVRQPVGGNLQADRQHHARHHEARPPAPDLRVPPCDAVQ